MSEASDLETPWDELWLAGQPLDRAKAAAVWLELLRGGYAVLAASDRAGHRHAVLCHRAAGDVVVDTGRIEDAERRVLVMASSAVSQKMIALTLGVAPSTVSQTLRRLRVRFGFETNAKLLAAFRARVVLVSMVGGAPRASTP